MSIESLNNLLSGEIKVTPVGPKTGIMGSIIVATCLAIGAGGLYIYNQSDNSISTQDTNVINTIKNKVQETVVNMTDQKIKNSIYGNYIDNVEVKKSIEKAGNFEVPGGMKNNQVGRYVSQVQFKEQNYLLALVSEGEGFRNTLYNDNIGFAFGNGWNLSMQNSTYNKNIASTISDNNEYIGKLVQLSGKTSDAKIPSNFNSLQISPQRAIQVSAIMSIDFEKSVVSSIEKQLQKSEKAKKIKVSTGKSFATMGQELYQNLESNEKAALVYHAYKVGGAGFNKYTTMLNSLVDYGLSTNKTPEQAKKVAESFTYKYTMNGEIKEDIRASVLVSTMFLDKNAFGYVIGKNVAPKNMKENLPIFGKYSIDVTQNSADLKIPDPVGEERTKIETAGGQVKIQIMPDINNTVSTKIGNNRKGYYF